MKKFIFIFITFLCVFSENALGVQFYDYRVNKFWGAGILTADINNPPIVCMMTKNNNVMLSLGILQDYTYKIMLLDLTGSFIPPTNINMRIRVDNNNIINTTALMFTSNGASWVSINLPQNTDFINQAISGNTLRIKLEGPLPLYLKFSLLGFTASYNYAMELCNKIYGSYNNDKKFFEEKPRNNKQSDEAYFQ